MEWLKTFLEKIGNRSSKNAKDDIVIINEKKEKKVALIVDYQNVALSAILISSGKLLDFAKLRDKCLEIGPVVGCFIFIPSHWVNKPSVIQASKQGFYVIACHGIRDETGKVEDMVDGQIIEFTNRFLTSNSEITDIVVCSHDGHMNHWIQPALWAGKCVHAFAEGKGLSAVLKEVVNPKNIYELPTTEEGK